MSFEILIRQKYVACAVRTNPHPIARTARATLAKPIPPCRAHVPMHRDAVQWARSVLREIPISPHALPLKGREHIASCHEPIPQRGTSPSAPLRAHPARNKAGCGSWLCLHPRLKRNTSQANTPASKPQNAARAAWKTMTAELVKPTNTVTKPATMAEAERSLTRLISVICTFWFCAEV